MMELSRYEELMLRHRHGDGSWGRLEARPAHHDPAAHDSERDWEEGQLYVCTTCDEEVHLTLRSRNAGEG